MRFIPSLSCIINLIKACIIAVWITGCVSIKSSSIEDVSDAWHQTQQALLIVNKLRIKNRLSYLVADKTATSAAQFQAERMAKAGKMSHFIGVGDSFSMRMKSHGLRLPAAENIASGQIDVEHVVQSWIKSPKHLKNMLGKYSRFGVAVARDPASNFRPYWAMVLSK